MAMTDSSVMPSSRAQGVKELLHPVLLPGVTAHPVKARARGQEQTCQFVSHASSYPGMFIERDGGTCVLLLYSRKWLYFWQKGSTDGSRWQSLELL